MGLRAHVDPRTPHLSATATNLKRCPKSRPETTPREMGSDRVAVQCVDWRFSDIERGDVEETWER